ncbi:hypothetical protein D9619_013508 [Psilocybe cf. subviscida]|uniref:mannan endo-1,4-beta-mannosidase n=1 Tax=Psilocybe cf. subviscida TaxID=2480587 RepID=A0A8H5BI09_9AGAR|nr:hypothetical protein D9619_013508 [Psilocybe cf. subviscida]
MKITLTALFLALSCRFVLAAVPIWGQCGGQNYSGETVCASGSTCVYSNPWYSQCLPGTASSSSSTTTRITTTATTTTRPGTTTITSTTRTSTSATPTAVPTGFVKTSGTQFTLNGSKFTVVGTNSYWVGLSGLSTSDMNKAFADIASWGATVVRTWGFNEVTSAPGGNYAYYQIWSGSTPTVNTGANGLQNFDNVVAAAKANGIRLIVALTNNWSDYGGSDVYVKQILNSANHDLFYTDSSVKTAFKNYIKAFVSRYANEPTIMAWELGNEPRCRGSTGTNTGTCTPATITAWAKEISAYIKSIDSNHLVALGDEGFYNQPSAPTYPYQGSEGIDFEANLAISTLDFGTFHSYPEHWGQAGNELAWGSQWIVDHATSMTKANKPVILEEFGVTASQSTVYQAWYDKIISSGLTGDLMWQAGSHFSWGDTHNDGYAQYPDGVIWPLMTVHAAALKTRA